MITKLKLTNNNHNDEEQSFMSENWLQKYNELNDSYKESLVFRIGVDSGFFAEYNNMVLALAYCMKHRIKFILSSKHAIFSYTNGWTDFFLPFCQENNETFNRIYNSRAYKLSQDFKPIYDVRPWVIKERVFRLGRSWLAKYHKTKRGITFLTQDLWKHHRDSGFEKAFFDIPELGFHNATLLEVTQKLIAEIWRYSITAAKGVEQYKNSLALPDYYISMQIRSGDKFIETKLFAFDEYIKAAEPFAREKNAFILTDDYRNIELLRTHYPDWNFMTLCSPEERGYYHDDFKSLDKEHKFQQHLKLFASVDICANSKKFIGTYSANPGMYMGMRCGENHCFCLDSPHWQMA